MYIIAMLNKDLNHICLGDAKGIFDFTRLLERAAGSDWGLWI